MLWRLLRSVLLLAVGVVGGFAGAAAVIRGWLPSEGDETSDELRLVAIFDGIDLASRSAEFHGGSVLAWFGGVSLDLRDTALAPGARLDVRSAFGGIAITVPPNWRVDAEGTAFAGGVEVRAAQPEDPAAPTLVVRAASVMGGVLVEN